MTPSTKPTTRLSSAYVRDRGPRQLVVTIVGSLIELRPKGLRSRETMDLAAVYSYAVKARMAHEKSERLKERKEKQRANAIGRTLTTKRKGKR